jgi:drug/metabolite transporter (DMT)-like permease
MPAVTAPATRPLAGMAYMAAGVAVLILSDAGSKWLTAGYPPAQIMFLRSVFTLIPVAVMVARSGGPAGLRTSRPGAHAVRAVFVVLAILGTMEAYARTPLGDVIAIQLVIPLLAAALAAPILGERVPVLHWLPIGLGLAGSLVIVRPGIGAFDLGGLHALLAAFCFAIFMNLSRRLSRTDGNAAIVLYGTLAMILVGGALSIPAWVGPDLADLALFAYIGVSGGIGQMLMVEAFRLAPISLVAPIDYTGLLWGMGLGYVLWGDVPTPIMLTGAAVVVASGLILLRIEARGRRVLAAASIAAASEEARSP